MKIASINPATEEINKEFTTLSKKEALSAARDSKKGFETWSALSVPERASRLRKLSAALQKKKDEFGRLITIEMGKPIKESIAEVEKCALTAEYYADNAARFLKEETVEADGKSYIAFEPLGTVLPIMPWNFPFWQALRFSIPAMAAGNVIVLRHSNVVPMCALAIESAFAAAGFPDHAFRTVITDHDTVKALIKSPHIDAVSLTGSTGAGAQVAQAAGKSVKKVILELGGSDPFIVLEDADIVQAAEQAAKARLMNAGQSCIAAKRFIVLQQVADEFIRHFVEAVERMKVGDPLDPATDIGPLARKEQLALLEMQVADAMQKGATILTGGKHREGKGYFFEPTVLGNAKPSMKVVKEEVFGPVAPVIAVKNEAAAVKLANDSEFGLGGSVWTRNSERGERIARRLDVGFAAVNRIVKSDPRLPFGGVKKSGIGRELSHYGMKEFVNIKTVVVG